MTDIEQRLREAVPQPDTSQLPVDLVAFFHDHRLRNARHRRRTAIASGVVIAVAIAGVVVPLSIGTGGTSSTARLSTLPDTLSCPAAPRPRLLPTWARSGFSSPRPKVPYAIGTRGTIVAILWRTHHPLTAPPAEGRRNKVLWVAKNGSGPLSITGIQRPSGQRLHRRVDLGPSIINVPAAGCWSFRLAWSGGHDRVHLRYTAP